MRVGIVVADFYADLADALLSGALAQFATHGIGAEDCDVVAVPGVVEIPLVAQRLAITQRYGALLALGVVIQGGTAHFDVVCRMASEGCMQVALLQDIPVIFGVLTVANRQQALARLGGEHGHKGKDAAETAVRMINLSLPS